MTTVLGPRLAGLVAAVLASAAGLVGLSSAPASAALCSGEGVNVVVDFNGLGRGEQKGCDPSGAGKSGDKVFSAAGFELEGVRNDPGFICRVERRPGPEACGQTPPANAYWGLYWSDGKSGKWNYSSSGVYNLKVPAGGFIAFSWQNGGPNEAPNATPRNAKPAPTKTATKSPPKGSDGGQGGVTEATKAPKTPEPTKAATRTATKAATQSATQAAVSATPQPARSSAPKASARASASAAASAATSPSATSSTAQDDASPAVTSTEPASQPFTDENGGLPAWVPVSVIVLLGGAAGAAVWWRKRTGAV